MENLPKTEQELNDLISAKVKEATDQAEAKHNAAMATMRQKYDADLKKAKEQANLNAEELAQQTIKEQQEADQKELSELRAYKKTNELSLKLDKAGLPQHFKYDTRLLNAEEGNLDKTIADVKKEYEATLPKGATHSTIIPTGGNQNGNQQGGDKTQLFENVGNALKDALGK